MECLTAWISPQAHTSPSRPYRRLRIPTQTNDRRAFPRLLLFSDARSQTLEIGCGNVIRRRSPVIINPDPELERLDQQLLQVGTQHDGRVFYGNSDTLSHGHYSTKYFHADSTFFLSRELQLRSLPPGRGGIWVGVPHACPETTPIAAR